MVRNVLREHHERNRYIGHGDCADIAPGKPLKAAKRGEEGEGGDLEEGGDGHAVRNQRAERAEVADLQRVDAGRIADDGEDGRDAVAREDADDERDQARALLAVGRAQRDGDERDEAAEDRDQVGAASVGLLQILDGVAREGQTDDGDRGPDDDGGHEPVDPFHADEPDDERDHDIHQTGQRRAEDEAEIADGHAGRTGKRSGHGADEREGRAEEHGALFPGEEDVDERADAGAEQRGCGVHGVRAGETRIAVDDERHNERCRHDGEQLLDGEDDQLAELRLVFYVVDEFHVCSSISCTHWCKLIFIGAAPGRGRPVPDHPWSSTAVMGS